VCCGRPYYDYGMLDQAKRALTQVLEVLAPQLDAGLPIVVLEPFGSHDTIAPAILELGDEVVPWDKRQLVDAIKRQARHEETTRFDTIEFKLD